MKLYFSTWYGLLYPPDAFVWSEIYKVQIAILAVLDKYRYTTQRVMQFSIHLRDHQWYMLQNILSESFQTTGNEISEM